MQGFLEHLRGQSYHEEPGDSYVTADKDVPLNEPDPCHRGGWMP